MDNVHSQGTDVYSIECSTFETPLFSSIQWSSKLIENKTKFTQNLINHCKANKLVHQYCIAIVILFAACSVHAHLSNALYKR